MTCRTRHVLVTAVCSSHWTDRLAGRFRLGRGSVIRGIDEAVKQMVIGEEARVIVSPDFAYGSQGFYPTIAANATLIVRLQLIEITGHSGSYHAPGA